jgi:hypothetical protein
MTSPDGKWVWDGQKWIPVAKHESVFPAYSTATAAAEAAVPIAETMVSPPVNPFAPQNPVSRFVGPPAAPPFGGPPAPVPAVQSPAIVAPPSYTSGGATPPWQSWTQGSADRSRTLKLGAAFIAVALLVILSIYIGLSQLPFLRASNEPPTATPSPTATPIPQLSARSDAAVAGRYVSAIMNPTLAELSTPQTRVTQACIGVLSTSCQDALNVLATALKPSVPALGQPVPACILPQVAKVRADLGSIVAAVKYMIQSYADNNVDHLRTGLKSYNIANHTLQSDAPTVVKAQAGCDGQPGGP